MHAENILVIRALWITLLACLCLGTTPLAAEPLELGTVAGDLAAMRKIQCSTEDGEVSTYGWEGKVFSRVQGERDRLLFQVEGMNIRQCGPLEGEEDGPGFRLITREVLLYLDPQTSEVLKTWENP